MSSVINQGSYRISGKYGEAWRDGAQLMEVTGVTAAVAIAQIDVPLAGTNKNGAKDGMITRTGGQLTIQKIDARWENDVYGFIGTDLATLRAMRDAGTPLNRTFSMQVYLDDPGALGIEAWQLDGCRLFNLPLGFQTANDLESRTYDFRWEAEQPIYAFEIQGAQVDPATGLPLISYTASPTQ